MPLSPFQGLQETPVSTGDDVSLTRKVSRKATNIANGSNRKADLKSPELNASSAAAGAWVYVEGGGCLWGGARPARLRRVLPAIPRLR